jgi:hypothetical protein
MQEFKDVLNEKRYYFLEMLFKYSEGVIPVDFLKDELKEDLE